MHIDQSDLYRQNSAVFKNFALYSPDPPSVSTEGLGMRLHNLAFHLHAVKLFQSSPEEVRRN